MKKAIFCIVLAMFCGIASAQVSFLKGLAFKAGYVYNPLKVTDRESKEANMMNYNGLTIGADYTLSQILGPVDITVGLAYTFLAHSRKLTDDGSLIPAQIRTSISDNHLEIPVRFSLGHDFGPVRGFIYAGPKLDFSLGGKMKVTTTTNSGGNKTSNAVTSDLYGENSNLTKFQTYLGAGIGAQFLQNYRVVLGYDGGLLGRSKGEYAKNYRMVNPAQVTLTFAYCF